MKFFCNCLNPKEIIHLEFEFFQPPIYSKPTKFIKDIVQFINKDIETLKFSNSLILNHITKIFHQKYNIILYSFNKIC